MNNTDLVWCILKLKTILYDVITNKLALSSVSNVIDNYREMTQVI